MKQEPVPYEQGVQMAERIGAFKYIECSAKTKVRSDDVVVLAITDLDFCISGKRSGSVRNSNSCSIDGEKEEAVELVLDHLNWAYFDGLLAVPISATKLE